MHKVTAYEGEQLNVHWKFAIQNVHSLAKSGNGKGTIVL